MVNTASRLPVTGTSRRTLTGSSPEATPGFSRIAGWIDKIVRNQDL